MVFIFDHFFLSVSFLISAQLNSHFFLLFVFSADFGAEIILLNILSVWHLVSTLGLEPGCRQKGRYHTHDVLKKMLLPAKKGLVPVL